MKLSNTLVIALLGVAKASEEHVITGTADNFDQIVKDNPDGMLAEFYAPWCGHCKKLAPEFEAAAKKLKEDGSKIPLVKIDATVETKLGEAYKVNGYPSLKWFVGGSATDYDGPREADGIVTWIKSMTGPAVATEASKGDETFAVTYTASEMGVFEELAKANRKKASWFFVKEDGKKTLTVKHLGEDALSTETADKAEMEKFFKDNEFPLYGALDGDSFGKYMEKGNGMIWNLMDMTDDNIKTKVEESRPMMTEIATELAKDDAKYHVTWTNTVEFKKVIESMFGISKFPKLVLQLKIGDKKNYIYEGEHTKEKIMEFINKVKKGEIKPNLKSEEPPAEPQTDPVKVMVGKTIETMAFSAEKDVLLEIYAPWCGHCKKLEPEYIKVGKKVQKEGFEDILTIAKMDGTLNDSPVESISWSGFPTIYYIKAGASEAAKYEGARDAKGIWKWIKKNHSKADLIKNKIADKQAKRDEKKQEL